MPGEEKISSRPCYQRDFVTASLPLQELWKRLANRNAGLPSHPGVTTTVHGLHTRLVAQIARSISRTLGLNEDATEAIALGARRPATRPLGTAGNAPSRVPWLIIAASIQTPRRAATSSRHNRQSVRLVECLEKDGHGLNLTWEVRDSILCHTGSQRAQTARAGLLPARTACLRVPRHRRCRALGLLTEDDLPQRPRELSSSSSERDDVMVRDICAGSAAAGDIRMSGNVLWDAMMELRSFLFRSLYQGDARRSPRPRA